MVEGRETGPGRPRQGAAGAETGHKSLAGPTAQVTLQLFPKTRHGQARTNDSTRPNPRLCRGRRQACRAEPGPARRAAWHRRQSGWAGTDIWASSAFLCLGCPTASPEGWASSALLSLPMLRSPESVNTACTTSPQQGEGRPGASGAELPVMTQSKMTLQEAGQSSQAVTGPDVLPQQTEPHPYPLVHALANY